MRIAEKLLGKRIKTEVIENIALALMDLEEDHMDYLDEETKTFIRFQQ